MADKTKVKISSVETNNEKRNTRPAVVSFRITASQGSSLKESCVKEPASGVNSPNQLARKLVCDFLAGRLVYTKAADRLLDYDTVGA